MLIVGIGGTTNPNSSSDAALRLALDEVEAEGLPRVAHHLVDVPRGLQPRRVREEEAEA